MSKTSLHNPKPINHYSVLGLPLPLRDHGKQLTKEVLRTAYHRALLLHHPDKKSKPYILDTNSRSGCPENQTRFTVDQIVTAYETLANPALRALYNETILRQSLLQNSDEHKKSKAGASSETLDLEDLDYKETLQLWTKPCRCGGVYELKEIQLDAAASDKETLVGCTGCSLSIRVVFEVAEE